VPLVPHSEATYLHYTENFRSLESFSVFRDVTVNLVGDGDPRRLQGSQVTHEFFDVMGIPPFVGRGFVEGEDRVGAEPVVVLGYALWQQSFGSDRRIMGELVELNGVQRRVVGVMPQTFDFPMEAELWLPLVINEADANMGSFGMIGVGRMTPDAEIETVQAEMGDLFLRYAEAHPDEITPDVIEQAQFAADVKPLKDLFVEDIAQALWVLLGTVGFVLLIACANVANLFLVRAEARQREQALRSALGATRGDVVRHYLTESVTLALGGGLLGLGLAAVGVRILISMAPVAIPQALDIGIDGTVLLFTAVISVGSGLLFGLFPVFGYARRDLSGALKEGGRTSSSGRERHRVRSALVVAQVALALVLLVGSGLMARSFAAVRDIDPGYDASDRLTFRVALPEAEYPDVAAVSVFHRQLNERLQAIPGVMSAAIITAVPLDDTKNASPMEAVDNPLPEGVLGPVVDRRQAGPGYFAAMEIDLLEGRELTWEDAGNGVRSVVVSETLARTFWPNESSVLNRHIRFQGEEADAWDIVGVARDVRFETLVDEPASLIYLPLIAGELDELEPAMTVAGVLHVGADPLSFLPAAREALKEVDPRLPMIDPTTVERIAQNAMSATSFTTLLLGIAAVIALLLGTVGIYGVISYVVSRRTQEIGVRMALGAPAGLVLRDVVTQGMTLTGVGLVIGLAGAWGVSRLLSSLLYGVSATDPLTYAGTALALAFVALLASWLPARKAAGVDVVEALRQE
jgi:predicted permease